MKPCCTDHNGKQKKKYPSREEAEKVAQLRRDEGVGINIYPCQDGDGWHLTSRNAPPPPRPKNVMTQEERKLYTSQNKNRLSSIIDEEDGRQLREEVRMHNLQSLAEKIAQLEKKVGDQAEAILNHRKELSNLRESLKEAEQDLSMTKRDLSIAKNEYELVKRRTRREPT